MTRPSETDLIVAWLRENDTANKINDQFCEPVIYAVLPELADQIERREYLPADLTPDLSNTEIICSWTEG